MIRRGCNKRLLTHAILGLFLLSLSEAGTAQSCVGAQALTTALDIVRIKAVGDIVLGSNWPTSYYPPGFDAQMQTRLKEMLGDADAMFGNFEGALTTYAESTKNTRSGSMYAFRMPPRFARLLSNAGFNVLHISNNHTFDFGETGFNDTIAHLADAGILTVGEKDKIALQHIEGVTLAWIGFSYSWRHNEMRDADKLAELIHGAHAQADLVIVSIQAGAEGSDALRVIDAEEIYLGENRGNVFAFARHAVDLGADLVLGHGPHVVRAMECYRGKLIAYSLGNFIGYGALSSKRAAAISVILDIKLAKNGQALAFDVLPVVFDNEKLPLIDPHHLARYLINDLSRLAPLTGSVRFSTIADGYQQYRDWLVAAELVDLLR